jgi:uncharacterized protein YjbJ (UPF0337 family)
MDQDRIKGSVKQVVGNIKQVIGKAVGDKKTADDGRAEVQEGKIQNAVGSFKDKIRDIVKIK